MLLADYFFGVHYASQGSRYQGIDPSPLSSLSHCGPRSARGPGHTGSGCCWSDRRFVRRMKTAGPLAPLLGVMATNALFETPSTTWRRCQTRPVVAVKDGCRRLWLCLFSFLLQLIFALRLVMFSMILLPPFARIGWRYLTDPRIKHGVRFGTARRHCVDIYLPEGAAAAKAGTGPPMPVIVAVMGGAWMLGYRAWNAQLGLRLLDANVMVVAVDYRNYPFATVDEMVDDLSRGLTWVKENVADYGGDPNNVVVTGQSAGAHLLALLLLRKCRKESSDVEGAATATPSSDGWSLSSLKGFVGVSGPYDLHDLGTHLESRGVGSRILTKICGETGLTACSPRNLLEDDTEEPLKSTLDSCAVAAMPPVYLFHGGADKTVPARSTTAFAEALRKAGCKSVVDDVRPNLAHAEVIIEGPMRGEDHQVEMLLPPLLGAEEADARLAAMPRLKPMFPRCIINVASQVMPF